MGLKESLNDFQEWVTGLIGRVTDEIDLGGFVSALTAGCMTSC